MERMAKHGAEDEESIEEPQCSALQEVLIWCLHCSCRNGGGGNMLIRHADEVTLGGTKILHKGCEQVQRQKQLGKDTIEWIWGWLQHRRIWPVFLLTGAEQINQFSQAGGKEVSVHNSACPLLQVWILPVWRHRKIRLYPSFLPKQQVLNYSSNYTICVFAMLLT